MRFVGVVSGNMVALLDEEASALARDLRAAIEDASRRLQEDLRRQVRNAGLGTGLEKAWQREVYPRMRRSTFRPAALVYSKATVLHDAFDTGGVITPKRSDFLVIPTEAGQRMGLGKVPSARKGGRVPGGALRGYADLEPWADRMNAEVVSAGRRGSRPGRARRGGDRGPRVVLVPSKGGGAGGLVALFYRRPGADPVTVARLMPRVTLRKLLDIAGAEERAEAALAAALNAT